VDAPVSGGVGGAAAGTLTFMAGGSDAAFARVAPLRRDGPKAVHCGASGAGQAAKICNNMILGVTMIATCEAFALADKLGLDRQAMFDVVSTSSGSELVDERPIARPRASGRNRPPTTATSPASRRT
jgi:3-hydroxyisobutyrate dehydrogenase